MVVAAVAENDYEYLHAAEYSFVRRAGNKVPAAEAVGTELASKVAAVATVVAGLAPVHFDLAGELLAMGVGYCERAVATTVVGVELAACNPVLDVAASGFASAVACVVVAAAEEALELGRSVEDGVAEAQEAMHSAPFAAVAVDAVVGPASDFAASDVAVEEQVERCSVRSAAAAAVAAA